MCLCSPNGSCVLSAMISTGPVASARPLSGFARRRTTSRAPEGGRRTQRAFLILRAMTTHGTLLVTSDTRDCGPLRSSLQMSITLAALSCWVRRPSEHAPPATLEKT
ncbi:hypothetical protein PHLGIDRAFT_356628 [Phlebiopsis gigantea 11061_1 CR5-6]|uniref:Uncharacterized protein n=1 Tax=Phlebiopsis gigantea (strain 11061_1 CR5-6) TaxID=745531 RepID=A0A0C3SA35_PHLG1|nr:hypothetical protein PHLGIDRAFT_356628 [Phlebiopsis gigantea 11061_1 CR5-6]